MARLPQTAETYDRIYTQGGHEGVYDLHYRHSAYYPLFLAVYREIRRFDCPSVLEVGCGTGGFAKLMLDRGGPKYIGFDFSPVAIEKASALTGRPDLFFNGDAMSPDTYQGREYECIVCTEVLEHIVDDLKAISCWRTGALCLCSVPNFDADNHERFFNTENEVAARYGNLIKIERISRVKKPVLTDISLRSRMRALQWARNEPTKFLSILGFNDFSRDGGWFVFVGRKN